MPIYVYECLACKKMLETFQGIKEDPKKKCPSCGKLKLERIIQSPLISFKGSGFHCNDYP